jgi:glutathione S-transferase
MRVFGHPKSRSTRVVWTLEEAGADYDFEKVDLMKGEARKPHYLEMNPLGKVPTLVDGDLVLTESAAICTYVAERFPAANLIPPAGTHAHSRYLSLCFFVIGELEQPLWTMAKHQFVLPEKLRVAAAIETARKEFERPTAALSNWLDGREYAVGDGFTVADVLIGHTLSWARSANVPLGHDVLETYVERILSRPALARARERESA